ncbi:MAG: hypothetical protein OXH63_24410 [Gemmatimonadetes bacterium]|nr:hypothetical protein [Gemmatimonadota bacterium]
MDQRFGERPAESSSALSQDWDGTTVPDSAAKHPVLSRLMEEVRNQKHVEARYDRVHNRHNRGR